MDACIECHETKEAYKPTGEPQCVNPECHCYMEVAREVYDIEANCFHSECTAALVLEVARVGFDCAESVCIENENRDNEAYFQGERREPAR